MWSIATTKQIWFNVTKKRLHFEGYCRLVMLTSIVFFKKLNHFLKKGVFTERPVFLRQGHCI